MSDLITYEDKIRLKSQNVSDKYKVTAEDMNEIKRVVNNNAEEVGDLNTLTTIDKTSIVNAVNELNAPENWVSVGEEAPTDGRRVWFKKSKNLFNINGGTAEGTQNVSIVIDGNTIKQTNQSNYARSAWKVQGLEINKQYTLSLNFTNTNASSLNARVYKSDGSTLIIQSNATTNTSGEIELTFTAIEDIVYIRLYSNTSQTGNTYEVDFSNIQLAPGSSASAFEPYVEEGIYVDEEEWFNSNNVEKYSTNEIKIGTWIDGKPIYRKTYQVTNISSSNADLVDVSGLNIDTVVKLYGFIRSQVNMCMPMPLTDSSTNYNVIFLSVNKIRGRVAFGTGGSLKDCYVTIEYTKN